MVPVMSEPRMVELRTVVAPFSSILSEPRLPAIQEAVMLLIGTGLRNQVSTLDRRKRCCHKTLQSDRSCRYRHCREAEEEVMESTDFNRIGTVREVS